MGIYYYKLWDILENKNITQRELTERLHISTATLTKMRKNQTVSLETLDLIREYLDCDFGDIITAVPQPYGIEVNWQKETVATKANDVYRMVLAEYMEKNSLAPQSVSGVTTLSLNTVKGFLKGKDLSSRSIAKLARLGNDYCTRVSGLLTEYGVKDRVYCNHPCGKRKRCFGLLQEFHPDTKEYEPYCSLGFTIEKDKNGDIIAQVGCPHPKNTREFGIAIQKYGSYYRGNVEYIPAKDESDYEKEVRKNGE